MFSGEWVQILQGYVRERCSAHGRSIFPEKEKTEREQETAICVTSNASARAPGDAHWKAPTAKLKFYNMLDSGKVEEVDTTGPDEVEKVNSICYC